MGEPECESRAQFEERLREEGNWELFVVRREGLVRELTAEFDGDERAARREAWPRAMGEFGAVPHARTWNRAKPKKPPKTPQRPAPAAIGHPLDVVEHAARKITEKKNAISREQFAGKPKPTNRQIFDWVFENIQIENPSVEECPSAGAWGLLFWAKSASNQGDFYTKLWKSPTAIEALAERFGDDGGVLSIIDKVAAAAEQAARNPAPALPFRGAVASGANGQ